LGQAVDAFASAGVDAVEAAFDSADTLRVRALPCAYHRPDPGYCGRGSASSVAVAAGHVSADLAFGLRHPSMESRVDGAFWAFGAQKSLRVPHSRDALVKPFGRWLAQSEEAEGGPGNRGRLGEGGQVPAEIWLAI